MGIALDPRTRDLLGIPVEEHIAAWSFVTDRIVAYLMRDIVKQNEQNRISNAAHGSSSTNSIRIVDLTENQDEDDSKMSALDILRRNIKRKHQESLASTAAGTTDSASTTLSVGQNVSLKAASDSRVSTEDLIRNKLQNEILRYSSDPPIGGKENLLLWWKLHAPVYPLLAKAAKKWLCVPATSAPVERLFSVAGRVVEERRSRLEPSIVDDIVFLHESFDTILRLEPNDTSATKKRK